MKKKKKKKNITFITNIRKTYKYARAGRKYLFLFFLMQIALTAISVAVPIITAKRVLYLTDGIWQQLSLVAIAIFVIEIFRNITRYFSSWSYNRYYFDIRRHLQIHLARETLKITKEDKMELNNIVKMFNPDNALAIAMNPNTGEVLGMSSRPNYDPNNYKNYNAETLNRNLPIWATYEPGSTFNNVTPLLSHKILYL